MIQNIYWEKFENIRREKEMRSYTKVERGVKFRCVFSPDLFAFYNATLPRELGNIPRIIMLIETLIIAVSLS